MKYNFNEIEAKWQKYWADNQTFNAENLSNKPKFYVLDMFPYPSGAGLHVGHPLGYIASDIYARYKRLKGFNVLHPQGYDSFGLPAEQYAIQTGQHPAITTLINIDGCIDENGNILSKYINKDGSIKNEALIDKTKSTSIYDQDYQENIIKGYRKQLDKIGFSFDWSREVRTSDPKYYKWTQWIFIQLYNSYYCKDADQAKPISALISVFEIEGNYKIKAACDDEVTLFTAKEWNLYTLKEKEIILAKYRLTYLSESEVNWCPALGTVLANDEIVNGVSERGGHPVIRKKMMQWSMRISAYAQRLLDGLQTIDWPQPLKDSQTNWIGRSEGAMVEFEILTPTLSKGEGVNKSYLTGNSQMASTLLPHAKEMRKEPTLEEAMLWDSLRNRKLEAKFRRQHLIGKYIVDFVCLEKKLVIEVDGEYHNNKEQIELDQERTLELEQKHLFKVIRFTNEEVKFEISKVLTTIKQILNSRNTITQSNQETSPSPMERVGVRIFTTRPDTIFGVSFITLAPEHELVLKITTAANQQKVQEYIQKTAGRSERERMADVKTISGQFTGAYAIHPFTNEKIPIWIGDYVLASYGTGAVMSVPCGDQRDYDFAKHFNLPIPNIFANVDISQEAYSDKENTIIANSDFINGLNYKKASQKIIEALELKKQGKHKINFRLRDAVFSRQRYWGEPFPVYYVNDIPQMIDEKYLPIILPEIENYLPTQDGLPPLGNANNWAWCTQTNTIVSNEKISPPSGDLGGVFPLELNTMPGWAGSSWYFNRYMDANNSTEFASKDALNYWREVDLYIGGAEHATGHLLYARFWQKFLFDLGLVPVDEFAKKLINQGMILGTSEFAYVTGFKEINDFESKRASNTIYLIKENENGEIEHLSHYTEDVKYVFFSSDYEHINEYKNGSLSVPFNEIIPHRFDVNFVNNNILDIEKFRNNTHNYEDSIFVVQRGFWYKGQFFELFKKGAKEFKTYSEVEKMSKSKYNVVSPDEICKQHGADSLRLFEMFLGPLEQAKPWNTAGITGVDGFLKKLWKLYIPNNTLDISEETPLAEELKTLHKTIKKVADDIENFSFNTSVSTFMIAVNELTALKCNKRAILEPLLILISPYAPHITEELWSLLGNKKSISTAVFPTFDAKYLIESTKMYPVSFNGKMKFTLELPLDLSKDEIQNVVMNHPKTIQFIDGKIPKNIIIVPGKIVNIVV